MNRNIVMASIERLARPTLRFSPSRLLISCMNRHIFVLSGSGCSHNLRGISFGEVMIFDSYEDKKERKV